MNILIVTFILNTSVNIKFLLFWSRFPSASTYQFICTYILSHLYLCLSLSLSLFISLIFFVSISAFLLYCHFSLLVCTYINISDHFVCTFIYLLPSQLMSLFLTCPNASEDDFKEFQLRLCCPLSLLFGSTFIF